MAWTTDRLIQNWVPGATLTDLAAYPTAATMVLRGRLESFIASTTLDTWLTELPPTPEQVVVWASQMGAALFLAARSGLHLTPDMPDNQAAWLYNTVEKEIQRCKYGGIILRDSSTGLPVSISVIAQTSPVRYFDELPSGEL